MSAKEKKADWNFEKKKIRGQEKSPELADAAEQRFISHALLHSSVLRFVTCF